MAIPVGTRLGHYEVISLLGSGGMGEVYAARDEQLERTVALKVLDADIACDTQRMRRFSQEAKAASALNHPNILTIYEFGQENSVCFIAAELVDGTTLRDKIERDRLKLSETIEIGLQVAEALAVAHLAGIVHRDIKPENIMVRRDGYVKVLDFGLAKLTEASSSDPEAATMMRSLTRPGTVMGTASYMSPEQARGLKVDGRTDIWSLGVVLYEMIARRVPFEGPTFSHVIVSILEKDPPLMTAFSPEVPAELQRVVARALAKDAEARYQSVKDLAVDLRQLKHRMELQSEMERSIPPERETLMQSRERAPRVSVPIAARTEKIEPAQTTGSTRALLGRIRRRKLGALISLLAVLSAAAGAAFLLYKALRPAPPAPFQQVNLSKLTSTGKATDATISPDGKYVVHVVAEGGQQSLWIRQVATTSNVQIVPSAEVQYRGLTFTQDGNFVYYVVRDRANPAGVLFQVPALGGTPKKILSGIDRSITFSPDQKQFAFVRNNHPRPGEKALMVANADGTGEKQIAVPKISGDFWSPAWSPDGERIACAAVSFEGGLHVSVVAVRLEDGEVSPITSEKWFDVGRLAWLPDGGGLLITATAQWSGFSNQIWHLPYPSGEARRITRDLNNYIGLGLTKDSDTFVTVQAEQRASVWVKEMRAGAAEATKITAGVSASDGIYDLSWTPDGKIVYESTASGDEDIWIMERDGSNPRQLTSKAGINLYPTVTPDGRHIVFVSTRTGGNTNIWRMGIDGSDPKQLTSGTIDNFPACSPDGRWVVYMSNVMGKRTLWKVPFDGGEPLQLVKHPSSRPVISPDGLIACHYRDEQPDSRTKIVALRLDGGEPVKTFDIPAATYSAIPGPIRWTADGRAITYTDTRGGVSNIWSQSVDGGKPAQLTDFQAERIFSFDWSRDGQYLAFSRGVEISDVVLISDLKKAPQ